MVESLDLQIARADLPADRYQGTLRLKIDGAEEALAINSTIEVRNGPLLAILAVIFGIIIGRLVRNRQSPLSQKQENLFPRLKELSASAGALKDQELRQYIEEEIKKARASVASSNEDEATVSQHVVEIGKKIGLLVRLEQDNEWLANTMTKESDPNKKLLMSPLTTYNNEVAGLIRTNMEAASKQLEEFEGKLAAAGMPAPGTRGGKRGGVEQPGTAPNEADNIPPSASGWSQLVQIGGKVLQVALHFVLGVDAMAVEQRFWFVKSLLFLVLLILLALIGLQTLYVNNGAIFGVNGIYDYIGLFLWGMSAEVAQRTLQDLGTPRPKS